MIDKTTREREKIAPVALHEEVVAGEVEFSRGTYQVQVVVGEEEFWPIVQFGASEEVVDALCACDLAREGEYCLHANAAIKKIYNGEREPLHLRFSHSLWNALGELYSERQGDDTGLLKKIHRGAFLLETVTHKPLFRVCARGESAILQLEALIERRVRETEETSLKFSGLSSEELALWREGRPSQELRYELSFWADLAKWFMAMQERESLYTITYEEGERGLPNELTMNFGELSASYYLSCANLPLIIPSLATCKSPLAVYDLSDEAIEKVIYDRLTGTLQIFPKEQPHLEWEESREGESLSGEMPPVLLERWLYYPGDGFYSREKHSLLASPAISPELVGEVLQEHSRTLAKTLVGEVLHRKTVRPSYSIWFDKEWHLHIATYLFDPGDLQRGSSRFFGKWAYLDDDGFYPLEEPLFDVVEKIVSPALVADFVHRHRIWLGTQSGFHTHLVAVESQLSYQLTEDNTLLFESCVRLPEGVNESHDFGDWIYIARQGFYSKATARFGALLRGGAHIRSDEIPAFIALYSEELELIPSFFTEISPIESASLIVSLHGKKNIRITPHYTLYPEYPLGNVRFFDRYVYVEGKGFSEIPKAHLLPERYRDDIILKGEEVGFFLSYELERIRPYVSSLDPRLQRATPLTLVLSEVVRPQISAPGLLALELEYRSAFGKVALPDIWKGLRRYERYIFSDAGLLDLTEPRFNWLRHINANRLHLSENILSLTTLEFVRLSTLERLECGSGSSEAEELLSAFASLAPPTPPDISLLKSELRSYQAIGVSWLSFLHHHCFGGLLCDDMGLGKTHQAMGLIAAVKSAAAALPSEEQPIFLIVCPTSVIYHWSEKLKEFLPHLRLHTFYGSGRKLGDLPEIDLLLTSYGILRQERATLSKIDFEIAIFDEIQVAKNHSSLTHGALAEIKARSRIGLTGTPIENNLRELKSLFDLVLPSYLPSDASFRDTFILPIEREQDGNARALLKRVISPFILRRKKEEVLKELPEKTEERAYCELSPEQRDLYTEVLSGSRNALLTELEEGKPSYIHIFAVLTALKRICDHPAVYLKTAATYRSHTSGKWELFVQLLSQARESEQKVVVFSQYLEMLDIIAAHLDHSGISYATIRGSTVKRGEELERFQNDPNCQVFIGSLQAAGLGIDLTAASIVIHYDRWWTKAREAQATDRVHRIGQKRGVQVFKLLTLGTLEERIDEIIERKGQLMEEIIGSDDASALKSFTKEELIELLSFGEPK